MLWRQIYKKGIILVYFKYIFYKLYDQIFVLISNK